MRYEPEYPSEITAEYLYRELLRIANAVNQPIQLEVTYVEPERPQDGEIRYADGDEWDPGIGRGFYWFRATDRVWVPFG